MSGLIYRYFGKVIQIKNYTKYGLNQWQNRVMGHGHGVTGKVEASGIK